ncbi:MAG: hypothetical protein KDI36_05805 [Pseudomonadales bacterium]|nr:hypothetical protein [Pseudomonadales bacterium]
MNAAALLQRFEDLSLREQALIVVTLIAILVAGFQTLLLDEALAARGQASQRLQVQQRLNEALTTQLANPVPEKAELAAVRAELAATASAIEAMNNELENHLAGFVQPEQMTAVLQQMLSDKALRLVSLENMAPQKLLVSGNTQQPTTVSLYRHGLAITLRGSYLDALDYIESLEQGAYAFLWEGMNYESQDYPEGVLRLELSTLGTDAAWLGLAAQ